MKKFILSKPFVFLVIIFSILIFFIVPVFGSTDNYTFNDFDGVAHSVPALPDISAYKYYVIVKSNRYYLFVFNNDFRITKNDGFFTVSVDDGCGDLPFYELIDSWNKYSISGSYSFSSTDEPKVVNSCVSLLKYGNDFNDENGFFFNLPTVETQGVLAPIVVESPLEEVVKEIVEILPIVLVTIVGLIGLRKALAMLSRVLHQS